MKVTGDELYYIGAIWFIYTSSIEEVVVAMVITVVFEEVVVAMVITVVLRK